MALEQYGHSALAGWRKPVADKLSKPIESKTPLSADQAQAIVGAVFFALSVYYVIGTVKRMLADA